MSSSHKKLVREISLIIDATIINAHAINPAMKEAIISTTIEEVAKKILVVFVEVDHCKGIGSFEMDAVRDLLPRKEQ